jgi:hypothetical protein
MAGYYLQIGYDCFLKKFHKNDHCINFFFNVITSAVDAASLNLQMKLVTEVV